MSEETTLEKFGARIGCIEQKDAVQDEKLRSMDRTCEEIKQAINSMPWKMGGAMATLLAIAEAFRRIT